MEAPPIECLGYSGGGIIEIERAAIRLGATDVADIVCLASKFATALFL